MRANSYQLFRKFGLRYFEPLTKVLEVGPDAEIPDVPFVSGERPSHSLRKLATDQGASYHFTNITNQGRLELGFVEMSDEYNVAFSGNSFRVVFSANVIEHVRKPWRWVTELARITEPGGHLIFVNPVSWPYHEAPVDCWRLYPEAYRALFEEAGLEHVLSHYHTYGQPEPAWEHEHGLFPVVDTIAIARKPSLSR